MIDNVINFTPLSQEYRPKGKSSLKANIGAFLGAGVLVLSVFVYRQIYVTPKTYSTKASEITTPAAKFVDCHNDPNNIAYPKIVSVTEDFGDGSDQPVLSASSVSPSSSVTFKWEPVTDAQGYYVMLTDNEDAKKGWLDPKQDGELTTKPEMTFLKLKSGKNYTFLIRSWSKKGMLSMTYPTPTSCEYVIAAPPLFEFATK